MYCVSRKKEFFTLGIKIFYIFGFLFPCNLDLSSLNEQKKRNENGNENEQPHYHNLNKCLKLQNHNFGKQTMLKCE